MGRSGANVVLLRLVLTPLLSVLVGCGDDDRPAGFKTGVDPGKPLGGISPAEAEQVCRSTDVWARQQLADAKQRELACRIGGLAVAAAGLIGVGAEPNPDPMQLRATCRSTLDLCLAAPTEPTMSGTSMCQSFPPTCMATVGEYEACLNDVPAFVDKNAASLPSCETVNPLSLLALAALANTMPASCQTFQMKCGLAGIPGIPPGTLVGTAP